MSTVNKWIAIATSPVTSLHITINNVIQQWCHGGPCGLKLITKDACSVDITHVGSPRGGDSTHIFTMHGQKMVKNFKKPDMYQSLVSS